MRVLMLTPQVPFPPDKGTRIRNFGLIKQLSRRHELGVITFGGRGDGDALRELSKHCRVLNVVPTPVHSRARRAARALVDPVPDLARRLASARFSQCLHEALNREDWDILQVEGLEMTPNWIGARGKRTPPTILDAHNAEWVLQLRAARIDAAGGHVLGALYSSLQALKLRQYEAAAARTADATVCVSRADERAIRQMACTARTAVVPNGIDCEQITRRPREPDGDMLLFSGTMDYRPNVDAVSWFVSEVWPRIKARRPTATFTIAGRDPTAVVRSLSRVPGVQVTGTVVEMWPLFHESALFVAPIRFGGGARLKLLEAFAHGTAVVTTTLGAEGIAVAPDRDVVVADHAERFASSVVELLVDVERRRTLADNGRRLVEQQYDWRVIVPRLEALFEVIIDRRRQSHARTRMVTDR